MADHEALLATVTKAIEALEAVKAELEKEKEASPAAEIVSEAPADTAIVSPDGAIGLTENDGKSVDWLFLPLHRTVASLPKKLVKGEPWPEAITISAPQPVPAPAPAAPAAAGSVCPNCGKPASPGSKFCMVCGTPIQAASAPPPAALRGAFCLNCGAPLKPGDKFCMKCGAKV